MNYYSKPISPQSKRATRTRENDRNPWRLLNRQVIVLASISHRDTMRAPKITRRLRRRVYVWYVNVFAIADRVTFRLVH
jgi:hypothetical protein